MYYDTGYNDNGALVYDANRGITNIEYDLRNNPRLIQFSDGSQTEYVYSALGEKLKTIHRTATPNSVACDGDDTFVGGDPTSNPFPMPRLLASSVQNTDTASSQDMMAKVELSIDSTEYIGNFIFENGHADKYIFPGGYYSFVSTSALRSEGSGEVSNFHYYLTDHLGSNRVVVNGNGGIEQTTHYYPFGAVYADAGKNPDFQKFKYTGKELDLVHGLNTYDHGARQNYSLLGVWDRVDQLAEKNYNNNIYVYCKNNPINKIDIDGNIDLPDNFLDLIKYQYGDDVAQQLQNVASKLSNNIDLSKIGIGFEKNFNFSASSEFTSEASLSIGKVMFLGGEDEYYPYTYFSGNITAGFDTSISTTISAGENIFITWQSNGEQTDHAAFAGKSISASASAGIDIFGKVISIGGDANISYSEGINSSPNGATWNSLSIGLDINLSAGISPLIDIGLKGGLSGTKILDNKIGKDHGFWPTLIEKSKMMFFVTGISDF